MLNYLKTKQMFFLELFSDFQKLEVSLMST